MHSRCYLKDSYTVCGLVAAAISSAMKWINLAPNCVSLAIRSQACRNAGFARQRIARNGMSHAAPARASRRPARRLTALLKESLD